VEAARRSEGLEAARRSGGGQQDPEAVVERLLRVQRGGNEGSRRWWRSWRAEGGRKGAHPRTHVRLLLLAHRVRGSSLASAYMPTLGHTVLHASMPRSGGSGKVWRW
jgi:hypothetical protein